MFKWSTLNSRQRKIAVLAWLFMAFVIAGEYHRFTTAYVSDAVEAAGVLAFAASFVLNPRILDWPERQRITYWPRWCVALLVGGLAAFVLRYAIGAFGT